MKTIIAVLLGLFMFFAACSDNSNEWQPAPGPLMTKWVKNIDPDNPLPDYPRPQMKRSEWKSLNGQWDYAIESKKKGHPLNYDGKILVPYPVESALSGVMKKVGEENQLWYRRKFSVPAEWNGKNILLNFGAVDWEANVFVNGKEVGRHKGGYDAFNFDITGALLENGLQEIIVEVWDPADKGRQPRGKQVNDPHGIWYTSVTGIWQTVWLEPVEKQYISSLKITPDVDKGTVAVSADIVNVDDELELQVTAFENDNVIREVTVLAESGCEFTIPDPVLWSPDNPHLYDLEITLLKNEEVIDKIESYFGMRKISLAREGGISKIYLNNEFCFQTGPLDQGWWPDGLYTAPTDDALRYDIEATKLLGFNMARKHVKVEPDRWYYWCDKLGLIVWQDMPSGDEFIDPNEPDIKRTGESAAQFELEWGNIIRQRYNHPSIVLWVPFNEGWGQYDTERIVDLTKEIDPHRLVINASGWADRGVGDINDKHSYPGPDMPEPEKERAVVLGEFGGLGLPLEGHTWQSSDNWGYRNFLSQKELTDAYLSLFRELQGLIGRGLSAAVYTQTTDVEVEVNGLMTYDRAVIKIDPELVSKTNQGFLPPLISAEHKIFINSMVVELSNEIQKGEIRYTLDGSQPGINSKLYTGPITLNETTTIKAVTFFDNGSNSGVNEKQLLKVTPVPPFNISGMVNGINYYYFEEGVKNWRKLQDLDTLTPKSSGLTEEINLLKSERDENFALKFDGFVAVPETGIYTFYSNSDDGTTLFIHDNLIVDNDYTHGMTEKSGEAALEKGLHPIKVFFFQGYGGKGLEVKFEGPGLGKQIIDEKFLFHATRK